MGYKPISGKLLVLYRALNNFPDFFALIDKMFYFIFVNNLLCLRLVD